MTRKVKLQMEKGKRKGERRVRRGELALGLGDGTKGMEEGGGGRDGKVVCDKPKIEDARYLDNASIDTLPLMTYRDCFDYAGPSHSQNPPYNPFSRLKPSHASFSAAKTAALIILCSVVAVVGI